MAGLGTIGGIAGLTQNIQNTESAQRELGTLSVLSDNLKKDRQENLMFQELEANEYAAIQEQASQLLERDRSSINDKSLQLQASIRSQIAQHGSRKKFFENGGLAVLKKYKTDLLNSEETLRFKDNKTNMERILALQASGKGHLLAPKDLLNLQLYQNGNANKITYSGLMTEVDYPAEFYAFGESIPDLAVLHYKDNYTRIYGNYITENGSKSLEGLDSQTIESELLAFMKKMNYQGIGKDEFLRQEEALERRERRTASRQRVTESGTSEAKEPKMSWISELNEVMAQEVYNKGVGVNQLLDGHYLNSADSAGIKNYLGTSSAVWDMRFKETATKSGAPFKSLSKWMGSTYFKPASAMKLPIQDIKQLATLAGPVNEDGTINYTLTTDLYNGNGQKFEADDVDDYLLSSGGMETEGKAKVLGAFLGFKTEDGKILMNVVDKKGNVKKDDDNENRKVYGQDSKSSAKHSVFIAMQSTDDDQVFYKEVDISTIPGQNEISKLLGEKDDISSTISTNKTSRRITQQAEEVITKNRKLVSENFNRASTNGGAFGNDVFVNEAMAFKAPDTGANRNNLIKAYYMTLDSFANNMLPFDSERLKQSKLAASNVFTERLSLDYAQDQLRNEMLNFNTSDSTFIKKYTDLYNDDPEMTADEVEMNNAFGQMWNEHYKLIQTKK